MEDLRTRLQRFFEDFATEREGALRRLPELFTDDVHFRDPFRDTHGIAEFRVLFDRMFKQYKRVWFTDFRVDGDDACFSMTYLMHLQMAVGPVFTEDMSSIVRTRDGRVCELVDHYDIASAVLSPVPRLGALYRRAIIAIFL